VILDILDNTDICKEVTQGNIISSPILSFTLFDLDLLFCMSFILLCIYSMDHVYTRRSQSFYMFIYCYDLGYYPCGQCMHASLFRHYFYSLISSSSLTCSPRRTSQISHLLRMISENESHTPTLKNIYSLKS
jgi:hypothetical protein